MNSHKLPGQISGRNCAIASQQKKFYDEKHYLSTMQVEKNSNDFLDDGEDENLCSMTLPEDIHTSQQLEDRCPNSSEIESDSEIDAFIATSQTPPRQPFDQKDERSSPATDDTECYDYEKLMGSQPKPSNIIVSPTVPKTDVISVVDSDADVETHSHLQLPHLSVSPVMDWDLPTQVFKNNTEVKEGLGHDNADIKRKIMSVNSPKRETNCDIETNSPETLPHTLGPPLSVWDLPTQMYKNNTEVKAELGHDNADSEKIIIPVRNSGRENFGIVYSDATDSDIETNSPKKLPHTLGSPLSVWDLPTQMYKNNTEVKAELGHDNADSEKIIIPVRNSGRENFGIVYSDATDSDIETNSPKKLPHTLGSPLSVWDLPTQVYKNNTQVKAELGHDNSDSEKIIMPASSPERENFGIIDSDATNSDIEANSPTKLPHISVSPLLDWDIPTQLYKNNTQVIEELSHDKADIEKVIIPVSSPERESLSMVDSDATDSDVETSLPTKLPHISVSPLLDWDLPTQVYENNTKVKEEVSDGSTGSNKLIDCNDTSQIYTDISDAAGEKPESNGYNCKLATSTKLPLSSRSSEDESSKESQVFNIRDASPVYSPSSDDDEAYFLKTQVDIISEETATKEVSISGGLEQGAANEKEMPLKITPVISSSWSNSQFLTQQTQEFEPLSLELPSTQDFCKQAMNRNLMFDSSQSTTKITSKNTGEAKGAADEKEMPLKKTPVKSLVSSWRNSQLLTQQTQEFEPLSLELPSTQDFRKQAMNRNLMFDSSQFATKMNSKNSGETKVREQVNSIFLEATQVFSPLDNSAGQNGLAERIISNCSKNTLEDSIFLEDTQVYHLTSIAGKSLCASTAIRRDDKDLKNEVPLIKSLCPDNETSSDREMKLLKEESDFGNESEDGIFLEETQVFPSSTGKNIPSPPRKLFLSPRQNIPTRSFKMPKHSDVFRRPDKKLPEEPSSNITSSRTFVSIEEPGNSNLQESFINDDSIFFEATQIHLPGDNQTTSSSELFMKTSNSVGDGLSKYPVKMDITENSERLLFEERDVFTRCKESSPAAQYQKRGSALVDQVENSCDQDSIFDMPTQVYLPHNVDQQGDWCGSDTVMSTPETHCQIEIINNDCLKKVQAPVILNYQESLTTLSLYESSSTTVDFDTLNSCTQITKTVPHLTPLTDMAVSKNIETFRHPNDEGLNDETQLSQTEQTERYDFDETFESQSKVLVLQTETTPSERDNTVGSEDDAFRSHQACHTASCADKHVRIAKMKQIYSCNSKKSVSKNNIINDDINSNTHPESHLSAEPASPAVNIDSSTYETSGKASQTGDIDNESDTTDMFSRGIESTKLRSCGIGHLESTRESVHFIPTQTPSSIKTDIDDAYLIETQVDPNPAIRNEAFIREVCFGHNVINMESNLQIETPATQDVEELSMELPSTQEFERQLAETEIDMMRATESNLGNLDATEGLKRKTSLCQVINNVHRPKRARKSTWKIQCSRDNIFGKSKRSGSGKERSKMDPRVLTDNETTSSEGSMPQTSSNGTKNIKAQKVSSDHERASTSTERVFSRVSTNQETAEEVTQSLGLNIPTNIGRRTRRSAALHNNSKESRRSRRIPTTAHVSESSSNSDCLPTELTNPPPSRKISLRKSTRLKVQKKKRVCVMWSDSGDETESDIQEATISVENVGGLQTRLRTRQYSAQQSLFSTLAFADDCGNDKLKSVRTLGGSVVTVEEASVLICDKIKLIPEILVAINRGIPVVPYSWLAMCHKYLHWNDPWPYLLQDFESESDWGFNLKKSLEDARKSKLLDGYSVFLTNNVTLGANEIFRIVESCGGIPLHEKPRTWPKKTIFISCLADQQLWPTKGYRQVKILDLQFLLRGVLRQELDFKSHLLRRDKTMMMHLKKVRSCN